MNVNPNIFILNKFPQKIQQFLLESYGIPDAIQKLNGIKSDGGCYRIGFNNTSVIVKQTEGPQEYLFYNECTRLMHEFKIHIPMLYGSYKNGQDYWIVIEDVQNPLPKDRWYADQELLELLCSFHKEMWGVSLPFKNHYMPKWNNELTYAVLELVSDKESNHLQAALFEIQKQSQIIFEPLCWINADTNPTNWGIRGDGTMVLFDWERISTGSPAIDLSITIPGFGTSDNSIESLISKRYLSMWSKSSNVFPLTEEKLLQEIRLAKFWSIIEFLGYNWFTLEREVLDNYLIKLTKKAFELIEE